MSRVRAVAMDAEAINEFLERQRTGVLSLASENQGYGIPLSFAYDENGPDIYLRLGYLPDSQKREFVDASEYVSFVVYDETDEGWKSVVARGRLEELTASNIDSSIEESIHKLDIPFVTIFERPASELEFRITRMDIDKLSGRREVSDSP